MERGTYRRVRHRKRAWPIERGIHELVARIGDQDPEGGTRKVAIIAPVSGFGRLRESLRKVLRKS